MRQSERKTLPVCQKCVYYKVTWDSLQPHACLFFDFKSMQLPAVEVCNSTGMACPQFRLSQVHARQAAAQKNGFRSHVGNSVKNLSQKVLPVNAPLEDAALGDAPHYSASGELSPPAPTSPTSPASPMVQDATRESANKSWGDQQEVSEKPQEAPSSGVRAPVSRSAQLGRILGERGILL